MVEVRALKFLVSVANEKRIADNLKILSWNYDRQFEIAAEYLRGSTAAFGSKIRGFTCWPNSSESENPATDVEAPFLTHLNGVAGYFYTTKNMSNPLDHCYDFTDRESLLSFAWDDEKNTNKKLFTANRMRKAETVALDRGPGHFPVFKKVPIEKDLFSGPLPQG
jgi:hypothetical protein